jgi:hypothetical protein
MQTREETEIETEIGLETTGDNRKNITIQGKDS